MVQMFMKSVKMLTSVEKECKMIDFCLDTNVDSLNICEQIEFDIQVSL